MEQRATVLVVDDEEDIVALMRDFLEAEGYAVLTASDGPSALVALAREPVDCVLLDVMMPGQTGFETLRRIRAERDVPVLFLSAKQEESDKLRGLGLGADDYIVKNATPAEVVARIKAVLRRAGRATAAAQPDATLDFGRLTIDVRAREARIDGEPVALTAREFELLQVLAEHPRQVLTRDQLYERLWGEYGDRHTLTVHVGRLREKIEEDPTQPRLIATVWGVGYRFEGGAAAMKWPRVVPSLPIRRWLAVAFVLVFFVPVFMTASIVWHVLGEPVSPGDAALERLEDDAPRWTDPAWQEATRAELAADGVYFVIFAGDQEIYRSTADPLAAVGTDEPRSVQRVRVDGTDPVLVADVYSGQADWTAGGRWLIPVVAFTSFVVTIATFAWFLGRMVVRPLAAASDAARRVAAGDLNVALPSSRVREVAELNASFEAMSAELDASLRHEAALEQERRLFIGAIVHDLRTPLFSLRGYLDGLARGVADTPEKRERYLAVARDKADALERLIADLFDFTRLEYLDQTPRPEPLDLVALLQRLVEGIRPRAETKGVQVVLAEPAASCAIDGDAHLLTRAIENLLDNGVRFTPSGGEVRVGCAIEGERAVFTVSDTGPGIPVADLPHLFTPLYRGDSSRNRKTGGAGLGLAIAKRIVQAHGGDLTAGNAPTGGAIFRASLPLPARPGLTTSPDADPTEGGEAAEPRRPAIVPNPAPGVRPA